MSFVKISDLAVINANELNGLEDVLVTKNDSSKKLSLAELSTFVISDVVSDIGNINNTLELKVDKEPNKGLSTEDFTTEEKNKLQTLQNYTLPVASETVLGAIKIGSELQINVDGILSINDVDWSKISSTPNNIIEYGITDAYNKTEVDNIIQLKANINSPAFTGVPTVPTALTTLSNNQIANTQFVQAKLNKESSSINEINKIVKRDNSGDFSANNITANLIGNSSTSTQLNTNKIFALSGDVSGYISSNLSNGFNIVTTVADNSHNHTISNITDLQTELNSKINVSEKASANGVATLDGNSKINLNQIPDSILGQLEYMGVHDFSSELPIATEKGQYWIASIGGNDYEIGDWTVWNGISFDKVDNTDAVSSVAGRTGNVLLTKDDVDLDNVENTADNTKNVLSATKWTTPRTIALSGDVAGSASVDGSANVTITTRIEPNSVALGTDTTGNYMVNAAAGSGISVSHTPGEGSTATITNSAPNVTTNITTTHNSANVIVNSSDGTDGTINSATQTLAGVMSATDKTKLDGIEAGATGDQTAAEIKTAYESNNNTNALTDSLLTLLTTKKVKNVSTDVLNDKLVITYTDDTVSNLNINDIITDIHVSGATLDATTNILTLTSTDGGADVTVDLSDFVNSSELTTALNTTVKLTGNQTIAGVKTFSSNIVGNITGNAGTATKLATPRTITLSGDVSGSASVDGSANVTITTSVQPNSVALGTDTTGNYVVGNTAGTGIVVTGTAGEGWSPTIALSNVGTAGTYSSVTTDAQGRVIVGTNPTTLSGYGITDATPSSHVGSTGTAHGIATTSVNGFMSSTDKSKLDGIATNANNYAHPTSGVAAGNYRSVTVNTSGHITAGTNPTTVSGYGLTDVYTKTENNTSLALKVNNSEKGVANGIATLDTNGKVVLTQLPDSVLGQLEYIGTWNFTTMPTATQKGQYWIASVAGNGYEVGDWAVWNGSAFDKVDNTDAVSTVAGRTGNVVLTKNDVGLGLVDNTADASKNVLSATKWAAARTITLSGDVAGSASIDGSANVTITSTVQPNSVTLGTDTTGNYVAGVTAGTGISISGTAGEGWSPTITNTAPNVTTNITTAHNATNVVVNSSDGTNGTINSATPTLAGVMTATDKSKLDGITTGATANVGTVTSIATSGAITGGTVTSTGTISHSTADGYLHVPATGTTNNGKVLTAGATAGSLSWTAIPSAPVTSVAGKTGAVTLVKADVGLNNVENTADNTKNVLSATKLTTARTIGGVSFDGTSNINLPGVNTAGNQSTTGNSATATVLQTARTIGMSGVAATATSFNGSANIIIPVTSVPTSLLTGVIADANISGSYTGMVNLTGSGIVDFSRFLGNTSDTVAAPSFSWTGDLDTGIYQPAANQLAITTGGVQSALFSSSGITGTLVGNSATATKLATARTIGGVSFDGTANINLPGVNTIGNQSTTGNAATANALTSGDKTISGTLTLSGSGSYKGISLVSSSTSWAYQEYKSGTNIFHQAFSSVAQTGAPANSMHFRTNGATTQMYVAPSEVGVNTNLNVTGLVNLGSTQQASVQYNSTDNSIDFIIN